MMVKSALIIVDVQKDFVRGGALPVPDGDSVVPVINQYIGLFKEEGLPVYATRDWHPAVSDHFKEYGGQWPPHCIQGTRGAEFHSDLRLPSDTEVVSAGVGRTDQGYSGFEGHNEEGEGLSGSLRERGVMGLYIGGLATYYCVRATALDALAEGFDVTLLIDAIRGIDVEPGDSQAAVEQMVTAGARPRMLDDISNELRPRPAAAA
jgi:nicotinamidase/pyrazinamidase